MIAIDFTEEDIEALDYERYHHSSSEGAAKDGGALAQTPRLTA